MICRSCKKEIVDKAKFCGYCGTEVKAEYIEIKEINNKKKVHKSKNITSIVAIFVLIIGIILIYNKSNEKDLKGNEIISNHDDNSEQKNNRDNIAKYIELFDGYAYFSGNYLYILENGLIKIYANDDLIYEEHEINEGIWYGDENEDLLNLNVDYLVEGDSKDAVINSIVHGMTNNEGWAFYNEEIDEYHMPYGDISLYYSGIDNRFTIMLNSESGIEEIFYDYNLSTKEECWSIPYTEIDYINREISFLVSQLIPGFPIYDPIRLKDDIQ